MEQTTQTSLIAPGDEERSGEPQKVDVAIEGRPIDLTDEGLFPDLSIALKESREDETEHRVGPKVCVVDDLNIVAVEAEFEDDEVVSSSQTDDKSSSLMDTSDKHAADEIIEPADEPVAEPAPEATVEIAPESVDEPESEAVVEPVVKSVVSDVVRDPRVRSMLVVDRTLRSGTAIRHQGDVLVYGDINAGAEVQAGGNIVVLGALRGMVHAGFGSDDDATIVALDLNPTQLRIGSQIAFLADRAGSPRGPYNSMPEVAFVRGGRIVLEVYTGRIPSRD